MSRLGAVGGRLLARSTVALLALAVVAGLGAAPVAGQPEQPDQPELARPLPAAAGLPPGALLDKISPRLGAEQGPVTVFVELERTPAIDAYDSARRAGRGEPEARGAANQAKDVVGAAVDSVMGALRSGDAGARELYRTANAVPGVAVSADAAQVRELAALPQVRSVHKLSLIHI